MLRNAQFGRIYLMTTLFETFMADRTELKLADLVNLADEADEDYGWVFKHNTERRLFLTVGDASGGYVREFRKGAARLGYEVTAEPECTPSDPDNWERVHCAR